MKSPLWVLTVFLPLLTELAAAAPAANPDVDSSDSLGEFEERDLEDRQTNRCRVKKGYFFSKYPCDSSDKTAQGFVGSQFTATCRYNNWYKASKGWVRASDKPKGCTGNWETRCP